jgi:hypothetical protein
MGALILKEPFTRQAYSILKEKYTKLLMTYEGKLFSKTRDDDIFEVLQRNIPNLIDKGEIKKEKNTYTIPAFFYVKEDVFTLRVIFNIVDTQDNLLIQKVSVFALQEYPDISTLPDIEDKNKNIPTNTSLLEETTAPIITQELLAKEAERRVKLTELENQSQCFGIPDSFTISNEVECALFGGKWDRQVKMSEECPFYLKSISMPLSGGITRDGGCQMPLGTQRIGYRYYKGEPLCFSDKKQAIKCSETDTNDYYFLD